MLKDGVRYCDGCQQRLPGNSKLSEETVSRAEAEQLGVVVAPENSDGTVTIDLCFQCRIVRSNQRKHRY